MPIGDRVERGGVDCKRVDAPLLGRIREDELGLQHPPPRHGQPLPLQHLPREVAEVVAQQMLGPLDEGVHAHLHRVLVGVGQCGQRLSVDAAPEDGGIGEHRDGRFGQPVDSSGQDVVDGAGGVGGRQQRSEPATVGGQAGVLDDVAFGERAAVVLGEQLGKADDGVERRAQLMAHVGQEAALGQGCLLGRVRGSHQLRDVETEADDVTIGHAALDHTQHPSVAQTLHQRDIAAAVRGQAFGDTFIDAPDGIEVEAVLGAVTHHILEARARPDHLGGGRIQAAVLVVAEQHAVVGVVDHECLVDGANGGGQNQLGLAAFGLGTAELVGGNLLRMQGVQVLVETVNQLADLVLRPPDRQGAVAALRVALEAARLAPARVRGLAALVRPARDEPEAVLHTTNQGSASKCLIQPA